MGRGFMLGKEGGKMVWAVVIVKLENCTFFFRGHPFTWRKRCHGICESLVKGPRQGAVASWIQDPNTLRPKKFRERLVLKNSNLLEHIRPTTADALKVGAKNPERESNYWKRQRVGGGHRRQPMLQYQIPIT